MCNIGLETVHLRTGASAKGIQQAAIRPEPGQPARRRGITDYVVTKIMDLVISGTPLAGNADSDDADDEDEDQEQAVMAFQDAELEDTSAQIGISLDKSTSFIVKPEKTTGRPQDIKPLPTYRGKH